MDHPPCRLFNQCNALKKFLRLFIKSLELDFNSYYVQIEDG